MGGILLRRSGAFVIAVILAIAAFIVIAPQARSQLATVQVGACETGASEAIVTVTIVENVHAVDIIDSDGVAYYFGHPGGSQVFPVGSIPRAPPLPIKSKVIHSWPLNRST